MNNWKKWLIIIFLISIIGATIKISIKKDYKSEETGNNKSIEEIEKYILDIKSYKAKINVAVKNNRNENNYIIYQEVNEEKEMQEVLEPEEIKGLIMTYQNGNLEIKNTSLNLNKIYENYPKISENQLFLTDFIKSYKIAENKQITEKDENTIVIEVKNEKTKYNVIQKLYINRNNLKPEKLEIIEKNNTVQVYILYNEIEINI